MSLNLDVTKMRLEGVVGRAFDFIDTIIVDTAIREILDPMRDLEVSRLHAQGFIDSWQLEKTGYCAIELINEFPYAHLLEYGWSEAWVEPVEKLALHWTDPQGDHFSKGHWRRGFNGYHMIEVIWILGFYDHFQDSLIEQANRFLEDTRMH